MAQPARDLGAPPVVEAEAVSKVYRLDGVEVRALDGVDLVVERGDSMAIMGPSGSGKSTLLGLLGGLARPASGTLRFGGRDVAGLSGDELAAVRNRGVGFVFQSFQLLARTPAVANAGRPPGHRGGGAGGPPAARARGGRAGSGSGCPPPGPWSPSRRCCWPTSPPATSTPARA